LWQRAARLQLLAVIRFTNSHQLGLLQLRLAGPWSASLWAVAAAVAPTAAAAAAAVAFAPARFPCSQEATIRLPLEPEALPFHRYAAFKAVLQLLFQSPARAVAVAEPEMEYKDLAAQAAPAGAAGAWMLLRLAEPAIHQPLPHRKGTMAALMRGYWAIKSAVAAVERELLAETQLLAARGEMAGLDYPAVLVALQPTMQEGAAALPQSMEVLEMVVLAVAVVEMHRALQILVVAVVAVVFRVIRAI
jgi:hypothetical protein